MLARARTLTVPFILLSVLIAFQPTAAGGTMTDVPIDNSNTGIVVLEVHEGYVSIDVSTTSPDVVHVPIYTLPDGTKAARGVLRLASLEEDILLPLVLDTRQNVDRYALIVSQDWPQDWDELIITLDDQDWPQYEEVIIPLDFQDWPQSWLPAEVV
jgi:hypothetical protein